ncbi:DMT family transporter [Desulfatibacillum aliphaticivorans]|uniref:DMT family transporter n=1 Tax=Desulfatibacillum aliphaticivorans TaxID=218208 RepID=UPI0004892C54|nr:EamA family transporter [Desulfatibacillum aliphaticivorans]
MRVKGYLYIAAAAMLWGMLGPFSRLALSEGLQPMEIAFWRATLAWGFFAAHAAATRTLRMSVRDFPMTALFALVGVTAFYGSYQIAIRAGGAAMAAVLLYTAPAWVCVIARFTFKERFTRPKILALAFTLIGVACVAGGGGSIQVTWSGVLFGLTAGFCYSLYYIIGKYFSDKYTAPNLFLYMLPMGAITLLPWVEFSHKSPTAWTALFCIAALCTYAAYFLYYIGLKHLEASRAAITATIEPVVAAVVAFFWWGESFGLTAYAGSALILSSVLLIIRDRDAGD